MLMHIQIERHSKPTKHSSISSAAITDKPRGQVTKFISGDDLDDDFMAEDTHVGDKDQSSDVQLGPASDLKSNDVKPKKKQGPKVVNFVG